MMTEAGHTLVGEVWIGVSRGAHSLIELVAFAGRGLGSEASHGAAEEASAAEGPRRHRTIVMAQGSLIIPLAVLGAVVGAAIDAKEVAQAMADLAAAASASATRVAVIVLRRHVRDNVVAVAGVGSVVMSVVVGGSITHSMPCSSQQMMDTLAAGGARAGGALLARLFGERRR